MTDRPTLPPGGAIPEPEVEITPEMIAVGVAIVWRSPIDYPTDENMGEMVTRVFLAMYRARP
jgi:hypothetical protein